MQAQEDVLLGQLDSLCLTPSLFDQVDIISPFQFPMNSSGIFMLFRNTPAVNALWRKSADAPRVLSDPRYLVFDEWWGKSKDHMPAVIGREVDAKRLRMKYGTNLWYASDNRANYETILCWRRGAVHAVTRLIGTERLPCFGNAAPQSGMRGVCIFHLAELKKVVPINQLRLSEAAQAALSASAEFSLTRHGLFLPSEYTTALLPPREKMNMRAFTLLAGKLGHRNATAELLEEVSLRAYLSRLRRCVDAAVMPRSKELGLGRFWCSKQRHSCGWSLRVRSLCVRTCGLCGLLGCTERHGC